MRNRRKLLWRLWIVASVFWIVTWAVWGATKWVPKFLDLDVNWPFAAILVGICLVVPCATLALGWGIFWAIDGSKD